MKWSGFKGGGEAVFCAAGTPGKGVDENVLARWLEQTCTRSGCLVDQNANICHISFCLEITVTETSIPTDYLRWSLRTPCRCDMRFGYCFSGE